MSRTKRITAFALAILAFFFFVGSPFGQSAKAIVGVDDALIAILIAALAAVGITFVTTGAYQSLNEYVGSLLSEYASENGTTASGLFSGVQTGTTKLGKIVVNNRFVRLLNAFAAWLQVKFGLINNSNVNTVSPGVSIAGLKVWLTPAPVIVWDGLNNNGTLEYIVFDASVGDVYITWNGQSTITFISKTDYYGSGGHVRTINLRNGSVTNYPSIATGGRWVNVYGGYDVGDWYVLGQVSLSNIKAPNGADYYTDEQIGLALYSGPDADVNNIGIYIDTGEMVLPFDDSDYADGNGAVIDVGATWGDTYDDVTGDVIPGEFSDSKEGEASIEYVDEEEAEEEVTDTPSQEVSQDVDDYQSQGLTDVFPFCIPFDIYSFFECLAADPVAPAFTWRFYVPGICDEEFVVDLAPFNSVAQIVRTMELLAFIVGLALVTRDKFLRG